MRERFIIILTFVLLGTCPVVARQMDTTVNKRAQKSDIVLEHNDSTATLRINRDDSLALTTNGNGELIVEKEGKKEGKKERRNRKKVVADTPQTTDTLVYIDITDSEIEQEEISTLDAAWQPVLVDHSLGIRGGWGTGFMRREPARENVTLPYNLWNFGISYRFDVPEQHYFNFLYVGTITFDLGYMQKGYAYRYYYGEPEIYTRRYDVIELPILWQPYIALGKGGSRFFISAGPFISYTLSSWEKSYNEQTGEVEFERDYVMNPNEDYFWNYGITVGGGLLIAIKRWSISAEFRYTIQLSDIMRGPEFIPGNPFRTPVDQMGASIGLHYKFSVGKEQQRKKRQKKN